MPAGSVQGKSSTGSSRPSSIEKSASIGIPIHGPPLAARGSLLAARIVPSSEPAQEVYDFVLRPVTIVVTKIGITKIASIPHTIRRSSRLPQKRTEIGRAHV